MPAGSTRLHKGVCDGVRATLPALQALDAVVRWRRLHRALARPYNVRWLAVAVYPV